VGHALIELEPACGRPPAPRDRTLRDLRALPQAIVATTEETLALIERERLHDSGCGAVDVVLPASTLLTPATWLWTGGRRRPPSECVPCG
jgi:hypothetical protein